MMFPLKYKNSPLAPDAFPVADEELIGIYCDVGFVGMTQASTNRRDP
jgi:hypothetical protein